MASAPAKTSTTTPHSTPRISQLDGLRGIAIILVILNHMRLDPLYQVLPSSLHFFLDMFTANGKGGVAILFMLSGYLMATIYPTVTSKMEFWQKRYTRIFPAFITMCSALAVIRYFDKSLSLAEITGIILGCIVAADFIWKLIRRNSHRAALGKNIFCIFLGTQILAALAYIFVLSKVPSAVFYILWPDWARQVFYWFFNSTLTLPFGNYIPQLDGVYWSLVAEILFYLLYPVIFLPLIHIFQRKKSPLLNALALTASLPFFYGISLLAHDILGFQMVTLHLAIYFLFGIVLSFSRDFAPLITAREKILRHIHPLLLAISCIFLIICLPALTRIIDLGFILNTLFWVIPIAVVFFMTLESKNLWSRILQSKFLVTMGNFSYSLYLTHTIAIEMLVRNGAPTTFPQMLITGAESIALMILFTTILHHFLEVPYFAKIKEAKKTEMKTVTKNARNWTAVFALAITGIFCIWWAYSVPVSPMAKVENHTQSALSPLTVLTPQPLHFSFTATHANLGMILIHLQPLTDHDLQTLGYTLGPDDDNAVNVTITDEKGHELVNTNYPIYQIFEARFHPIGVPLNLISEGEKIDLAVRTTRKRPQRFIFLVNDGVTFRSVYFFDRKTLLTHPLTLAQLVLSKLTQPFKEKSAQTIILLCGPLAILLIAANYTQEKRSKYGK